MRKTSIDGSCSTITKILALAASITACALIIANLVISSNTNNAVGSLLFPLPPPTNTCSLANVAERRQNAYSQRVQAAISNYAAGFACVVTNGDETLYAPYYFSQFTKGMEHDPTSGVVVGSQYQSLISAVQQKTWAAFQSVPQSASAARKYVNPMAGLAYDLIGSDSHQIYVPPPPTFSSDEQAAEYIELAWMALARDVPFDQYGSNPTTLAAIAELNGLTDYKGITPVTAANLFRANIPGTLVGPYLSQFFYQEAWYGANPIQMKITPYQTGVNYVTNWTNFINIQNGGTPLETQQFENFQRYMINGRDLAAWVHIDMLAQAYHMAVMILLKLGAPWNPTNPYLSSSNMEGFSTFGGPHVTTMVLEMGTRALHAAWNGKWNNFRRLRPEAYGGCVDRNKNGIFSFPVAAQVLNSAVLAQLNATYGSYLLPQAFIEGSPLHGSYPAGHATVAGACSTILKAFFDGNWVIPAPLMPNANGSALLPYSGNLTVTGEVNKIAANVGIGRNIGGVHYLSDFYASLALGEQVAIKTLRDYKATFAEAFSGWSFQGFDGETVTI